jgi:uncharacterized membrane protein
MFIKLYFIALPILIIIDMIWLGLVAKNFYRQQIGFLTRPDINWFAAILFYLLFIVGLVLFVIVPSIEKHSWLHAFLFGTLGRGDCSVGFRFNVFHRSQNRIIIIESLNRVAFDKN